MADEKKPGRKLESIITPPLTLKYAYVTKPDTTYKTYNVQAILDPQNDPVHKTLADNLRTKADPIIKEMLSKIDDKRRAFILKTYTKELPIKDELVEYQPTGKQILKAKSNLEHPPAVFVVNNGKLETTTKAVFGGSVCEIKALINPYVCDSQKTYGISLLLVAVKVNKFGAGKPNAGAATGFSVDTNTEFSATPEVPSETPPTTSGDTEDIDSGSF